MSSVGNNASVTAESSSNKLQLSNDPTASNVDSATKPPLPQSKSKAKVSDSNKRKSWVWNHVSLIKCEDKNQQKGSCNYCAAIIACPSRSGTSSLSNYLNRCKKYPNNNVDKKQKKLEFKHREGGDEKVMTTHIFDQERCRKALARMIIVDELPFKYVEREGFLAFCDEMQPSFVIPSRRTLTRDCYDIFLDEKKRLKNFFSKLSSCVCLTTDSWTSIQNLNYMCLTAHFIDDEWTLHKKIINFCPITSHAGEVIGRSVESCLLEWGINKVLTITVDNASSNNTGLLYLKKRLNSWKRTILNGDFLHMRCAAHILNLTVREGLKELDDSIFRIRSAIRYVRSAPARAQKFKSCIEKERIESKSLVCLDVETRWNSTYLMLESAVKFQQAFDLLETVDNKHVEELTPKLRVGKNLDEEEMEVVSNNRCHKCRGVPTKSVWEPAKNLLPFLKAFYESTVKLSGSLCVTGNNYMIEIYAIGFLLNMLINSDDPGVSLMASRMKKKHDKYWANVGKLNILLSIAVILDPCYKLKYVSWVIDKTYDFESASLLKDKVKMVLKSMFDSYGATRSTLRSMVSQQERVNKNEVNELAGAIEQMNSMYFDNEDDSESTMNKSELDIYLLELRVDRNDPNFEILKWWKPNADRYPVLSMIARDVLAIPVSTVASESAFSTGGRVLDSFRSSLTPRMVEALICVQDWVRKSCEPFYLEEILEDLEKIEAEISCVAEDHSIINIEE